MVVLGFVCMTLYLIFFGNHLDEEERAGCIAFINQSTVVLL